MTPREFRALFREFDAPSWGPWANVEDAIFGVEPEDPDLVRRVTGRQVLPTSPVSEAWIIVGRGAGKSRVAARLAAFFACGCEYRRVPGEHVYIGVFAPDRKQARVTFGYVRGLLQSVPALAALIVRETVDSIELSTGVIIEVVTASNAAPRGRTYVFIVGEEFGHLRTDEHGVDSDRELLRAVRPALARAPRSLLLVISSPYAERGELHRVWHERFGKHDPDMLVVQADTATMNPSFSAREIARAYRDDPESAAAEYGATFRRDVAELFGPALADVIDAGVVERAPERGRRAVAHFDGATGSGEDDAALAIAWSDGEGRGVLVALRRWEPPFSAVSVVQEAARLLHRYGVDELQIDRFAPGLFTDLFASRDVTCSVAGRDTSQTFLELLAYVNAGRVLLLDDETLLTQLRGLERRTRAGGRDAVGHRSRGHDDVAAACAGALVLAAGDDAGDADMPLLFGPAYSEWWARRHGAAPVTEATREERAALWTVAEPWADAVEMGDDEMAAVCWAAVDAHVGEAEGRDVDAGRRLRALLARVEKILAGAG